MRMIPSAPSSDTQSSAEKKIFKRFENLSESDGFEDWICLHSLRLSKSEYTICGEIDFLLIGPQGIFVCEVKGGRVAFNGRSWIHTNRFGSSASNDRGPIKQAEQAMFSLKKNLSTSAVAPLIKGALFGWFVAFPDIEFDMTSQEWEGPEILDRDSIITESAISESLKQMVSFWGLKAESVHSKKKLLTREEIDKIASECRPLFDRSPSMKNMVTDALNISDELTEEQYRLMDLYSSNPRIICEGSAGTGKSFVGLELARRRRDEGLSVLVTARNPLLLSFLLAQSDTNGIDFLSWPEAHGSHKMWDFVVVDEAQDLLTIDEPFRLDSLVAEGIDSGSWILLLDRNSQTGFYGVFSPEQFDFLAQRSTRISLTKNCRNTANIISQIREVVNADYETRHDVDGPPVLWTSPLKDLKSEAVALENFLSKTLMAYGFDPSDVTILELDSEHSPIGQLPVALRNLIRRLDEKSISDWPFKRIGLSSVKDFKGMESNVVCVVAARGFNSIDEVRNALYVAMSRSRALLWIANTPEFDSAVKELISD